MIVNLRTNISFILIVLGAATLVAASFVWRPGASSEHKIFLAPPPYIEYFVFGHREIVADSLWIRAIQDFDYCEEPLPEHLCKGNGWLAQMLIAVTNLSPKFRVAYGAGALALTVLVSDYDGASKLFDKGVVEFPNDYRILYNAAYHALYEEKNNIKAASLLERAAKNGGPPWMYNLATRLYSDSGEKELGLRLYNDLRSDQSIDPAVLKRMREKLGIPD